jgi:hypothetical protein
MSVLNQPVQVMLDLETLGTRAGGKVLQIGAVVFSQGGLGDEFCTTIDRWSQGTLTEDPNTVAWWASQDSTVSAEVLGGSTPLPVALRTFDQWLRRVAPVTRPNGGSRLLNLWGNGADFDNVYLLAAYTATFPGIKPAWSFRGNRCFRTLKSLRPEIELVRVGSHHNALDDAKTQALHAVKILRSLDTWAY